MRETPGNEIPRRTVLAAGATVASAGAFAVGAASPAQAAGNRYFKHGVASGDPYPDSVVLWTRVTPTSAATPGSGKGPDVTVRWQVARDRDFHREVRQGTFRTSAKRDHSVCSARNLE